MTAQSAAQSGAQSPHKAAHGSAHNVCPPLQGTHCVQGALALCAERPAEVVSRTPLLAEDGINPFFDRPVGDYGKRKWKKAGAHKPGRKLPTYKDSGLTNVSKMPEYAVWRSMLARCMYPTSANWKYYGGRGIKVCDRWKDDFGAFLADMGRRPEPKLQVDRIDTNGNYEPGNCRWATPLQNMQNRRYPGYLSKPKKWEQTQWLTGKTATE